MPFTKFTKKNSFFRFEVFFMETHIQLTNALKKLLLAKERKPGTPVRLTQQFIVLVCETVKNVISQEPVLLHLSAPTHVVGDIHGQFYDLLRIFEKIGNPQNTKYVFLGDYVDRGDQSIETVVLLFIYKILYPENVFLLRGNHEIAEINELHGFKSECITRYSSRMWVLFNDVFNYLPIAAIIGNKIFAVHGGISPEVVDVNMLETIERPLPNPEGFVLDFLTSDPDPFSLKWGKNPRGSSYIYGAPQAHNFLDKNELDVIVRAHQMVDEGFEFPFEPDRCVVTVFSAPYMIDVIKNPAAVMNIDDKLCCTFTTIQPIERRATVGKTKKLNIVEEIISPARNYKHSSLSKSLPNKTW